MTISVLVTGIGAGSHGEQILKALKLSTLDLNIIGTDMSNISTGKMLVDTFYIVPGANNENYLEELEKIIKKHNVKFIFHGSEPELKKLSENRDWLNKLGVEHPLNSEEVIELCMNKYETYKLLESKGISLPRFCKINSLNDIASINYFPVVLKPSTGSGGSASVFVALDAKELSLFTEILLKRGIDVIAQEYVGSHDEEYTVGISSDHEGNIMGSIAIKRIISNTLTTHSKYFDKDNNKFVISSGVSQGRVIINEKILKQAEEIALAVNSKGPLNIQCRVVDNKLYLFEINPRLSGTTSLRAMVGYNEPELLISSKVLKTVNKISHREACILRTIKEVEIEE